MNILEAFRMALGALRASKLRSALTLLGMVIGVFAVISAVTAVEVIDVYFEESLQIYGSSTFSIERQQGGEGGRRSEAAAPAITYEQAERLKRMAGDGLTVSLFEDFDWIQKTRYAGRETEPSVMLFGADEHFLGNYGFELAAGRAFTAEDLQYARPVALLGSEVADVLFPNETPLGKDITIGRVRLRVVGVLEEKGSFLGYNPDNRVMAPITYLMSAYGDGGRNIADVSIRTASLQQVAPAKQEVISHMRVIRKVGPGQPNDFELESNDSIQRQFDAFTGALTAGGAGIGLIALLAAGIGIMNIMLVSVTERTREIGIRKAVGAKQRDIMRQFLLEAFFLCQIGGLLGIALGALFGNLVAVYFDISAAFPWAWAIGGVVAVTGIALVFGGYPAWKAARLDPIESLRYE